MYESTDKNVSHPNHYQSNKGLEVIDVIEAFTDGLVGIEATDTGNVIKYICRWKKKNGIQDLEKALWYLQHLVDHMKATETPGPKADVKRDEYPDGTIVYRCAICGYSLIGSKDDKNIEADMIAHIQDTHRGVVRDAVKMFGSVDLTRYITKCEKENA